MVLQKSLTYTLLLTSSLLFTACGSDSNDDSDTTVEESSVRAQDARSYAVDPATLPFDSSEDTTTDTWHGVMDNGAGYRVEVPENWNGILVMWTHGYRGTGEELTVSNPSIREWLIENNYAWAASSYSKNYYDVEAGVEDTNELALKFTTIAEDNGRTLTAPVKTFIVGQSMGGHVAAAAVEQETLSSARNQVLYDGALPMCGVVGGTHEFDYLLDFTFAAQHVAGLGPDSFPADFDQPAIDAVLWDTVPSFTEQGVPTADGLKLEAIARNLSGGDRPVFEAGFRGGYYNVVMGTGGRDGTVNGILEKDLTGNTDTVYQLDNDPSQSAEENTFNNTILRVEGDPTANAPRSEGLRYIPEINGQFTVPVLTIHGLGDLYVPFVHEQIYRRRAIANGSADLLVQRAIRAPGHCDFTADEQITAFSDLANWVINDDKPDGDNVLDAAQVADEAYGCEYSDPARSAFMDACSSLN
ncbi:MAG: alpha/beta hydrolase [Marinobacter sp.]|uniref:alpha/beta hydrolase n=1 Tax=Marinobacter sp. TaxID=50741 RepID=UPI0034A03D38